MLKILSFITLLCCVTLLQAKEYQSRDDFLSQNFKGIPPKAKLFWLKKEIFKTSSNILKHKPGFLRTRYWQSAGKTVWIINEIGKTKPITIAVVIQQEKIVLLKVLAFRESRGWEVKHAFFTDQFKQNSLDSDLNLSQPIDGISGATLSVQALTKVAQLALFFSSQIQHEK